MRQKFQSYLYLIPRINIYEIDQNMLCQYGKMECAKWDYVFGRGSASSNFCWQFKIQLC